MNIKKALLIHKNMPAIPGPKGYAQAHKSHQQTLKIVEKALAQLNISYTKHGRGKSIHYDRFDFIITVGGDGTFLQAARFAKNQIMFGVNSAPMWSVGKFCSADATNVLKKLDYILHSKKSFIHLNRLALHIDGRKREEHILNEVLISHKNPAAMSRYLLRLNNHQEMHKSSGLWIATAAGSTGGINSAGGKALPLTSTKFQYLPRELYQLKQPKYKLKGGLIADSQTIVVKSLMEDGLIFCDGPHHVIKFPMKTSIKLFKSKVPLKFIPKT